MKTYSTKQAAQKLGIAHVTLQHYISVGKIKAPRVQKLGNVKARLWYAADIEKVRKQLPNIANGRRKKKKRKK